jgi:hypothetical protein
MKCTHKNEDPNNCDDCEMYETLLKCLNNRNREIEEERIAHEKTRSDLQFMINELVNSVNYLIQKIEEKDLI